jgi:hypothetical protein
MTRALKLRLLIGFVLVFVAGGATGLFAGAWHARQTFAGRHGGMMADRMRDHLRHELNLTPAQMREVEPILREMGARLQEIRRESGRRVTQTMEESRRALAPHLTPEQQQRLEGMKQRHLRQMHRRRGAPPPPPPDDV